MSHLRPNGPDGHAKNIEDYTDPEKASALTQTSDAALQRIAKGKPIDKKTAQTMVDLAEGTGKEGTLPAEVIDAATEPDAKKGKKTKGADGDASEET